MNKYSLLLLLALISGLVQAADPAVEALYNKSCIACHSSGAAGAPRTGDVAQWQPRLAKGMDTLIASVVDGLNAMPAKGMCYQCSNEDFRALIEYMVVAK